MKYICIKQHDITDCGAACLATISKQYGFSTSITKIREGVAVEYVSCEPTEGWKELFPEEYGEEYEVPEDEETEQA